MKEVKLEVREGDNIRLDVYVSEETGESRNKIQGLIKKGLVLVNGKKEKASYLIESKDVIDVQIPIEKELKLIKEDLNIDVIYEDEDIAIINKEKGMVIHPAPGHEKGTLANGLLYRFEELSNYNGDLRPGIVHRLDKDTSGLLVIAKNNFSHKKLAAQFKKREVNRGYTALVFGRLKNKKGIIDAPIGRSQKDRKKMAVTNINSKEAVTKYEVIEEFENYSLLKLNLKTGRTHQIRVHMNYLNHPIVGDPVYSRGKNEFKLEEQFLHAIELGFTHPRTEEYFEIQLQELPKESKEILESLRRRENGN